MKYFKRIVEMSDYLYLTTNADFLKIQVFTDPREGNNYFFWNYHD